MFRSDGPLARYRSSITIGSLYYGIALLPLTEGSVLYSLNPLFVAIFSRLILKEAVSALRWLAVAFFLAGAFVSIGPAGNVSMVSGEGEMSVWIGRGVMVLGAIAAATSVMCARSLSKFEKTHWAAQAWWQAVCATSLAPLASFTTTFQVLQLGTDAPLFVGCLCLFGQLCWLCPRSRKRCGRGAPAWTSYTIPWQIAVFIASQRGTRLGVALVFVAALVCVLDGLGKRRLGRDCCCCAAATAVMRDCWNTEKRIRCHLRTISWTALTTVVVSIAIATGAKALPISVLTTESL